MVGPVCETGDTFARGLRRCAGWLLALLPLWASAAPVDRHAEARDFDRAFDATMARYRLPGLAVGVIEDGEVVWTRTAGELRARSGQPVTPRSLFKIASNSKAMTASVLARLVQAGRLRWDDPVVKYLPGFAMHDPWVTRHMTVRDLLVHDSGLPEGGGDLMLWPEPNAFTRADILHGLRWIKPAYGFRAGYGYDNLLYVVAGEVAAAAGGAPYETLVRREVFAPLGHDGCRVGEFRLADAGEVAQPHMRDGERNVPIHEDGPAVPAITSAAAGGIRCGLDDMLAWARNWLAPTPAQLQWLGPAQRAEMWQARTPMPISARRRAWDDTHYFAYAFGFRLADVDGAWTVSHTGTLSGMYSAMVLLPDRKAGFVMLTNGEADAARTVLTEVLLKHFTAPAKARSVESYADELAQAVAAKPAHAPVPDVSARHPASVAGMRPWLGVWRDPWFGDVSVCPADGGVEWRSRKSPRMHGQVSLLDGRHLLHWDDPGVDVDAWLDFAGTGKARALRMAKIDPQGDFSSDYEDLAFAWVGPCGATPP
ncbi:MAG: serine hydrolase [Lysobacter sp.]|nr:serine hydrolase [Lysobacter sp.]